MKVYKMTGDLDYYRGVTTGGEIDDDQFNGKSLLKKWKNMQFKPYQYRKKNGDIRGFLPGIPVVTENAKNVLTEFLGNSVEFLESKCNEEILWIMNVINVIDCIDYKKAKPVWVSRKTISHFEKMAFKQEKILNEKIFKIPEKAITTVLITEEFKNKIENENLKGFYFIEVWDSEKE